MISVNQAAEETKKKIPGRAAETITLLHFSDICNSEAREVEPVGGAARFLTAVKEQQESNPLILFSGNVFSPSMSKKSDNHINTHTCIIVSTFTKGDQMIPVLNQLGIHCAVLGNHDFGKDPF